jgi:hypothetical protein
MVVATKRMAAMPRVPKNSSCLLRKSEDSSPWSNAAPAGCLTSDAADRSASNRGHSLQQVSRPWIAMKSLGNAADAPGQVRRCSAHSTRDSWNCFGRQTAPHFGCYGEQLAGRHTNQGQELLGCFVLGLRFGGQLPKMFHRGVGVDLAHGVELPLRLVLRLALALVLELLFTLAFSEQAAGYVANGAKPALPFQAGLAFHFLFKLFFALAFDFTFAFLFALALSEQAAGYVANGAKPTLPFQARFVFEFFFQLGFQFALVLIGHDDSSSHRYLRFA